ncbi:hypothetical protein F5H01DRAFT_113056 [Linnemannia elongata]|nr:hypothetical protein F5H01DRAFT_113056 [Linnemannia elongata]
MTADEKNQRQQQPRDDEEYDIEIPAGIAPEAYYDSQLSPLRASLRRFLLPYIRAETPILHSMQLKVRHPILDVYFTTTAFSGNHTFFMIALPVLFWFGFSEIARGFTLIAAMGVYWAGFFKVIHPQQYNDWQWITAMGLELNNRQGGVNDGTCQGLPLQG